MLSKVFCLSSPDEFHVLIKVPNQADQKVTSQTQGAVSLFHLATKGILPLYEDYPTNL